MAQKKYYFSIHSCPHWLLQNRSCQRAQNGLYLPVTEHVEIYCEGGQYASCPHFIKLVASPSVTSSAGDGLEDRRRHRRVPGRFLVSLAECADDARHQLITESAITVDISSGGICFESSRALTKGSTVLFSQSGDSSSVFLHGTGQVQWCRSLDEAHLYHAGVSFVDNTLAADISERLGLPAA